MIIDRFLTVLCIAAIPAAAAAQPLPPAFDESGYAVTEADRALAIGMADAARQLIEGGDRDLSEVYSGLATGADMPFRSYGALFPRIAPSEEQLEEAFETLPDLLNDSPGLRDFLEIDQSFRTTYYHGLRTGLIEVELSDEEAMAAYLRGLTALNIQLDIQERALGRFPGSDQRCWWPFCPTEGVVGR